MTTQPPGQDNSQPDSGARVSSAPRITLPAAVNNADVAITELGNDLRAITSTVEFRHELISNFLQLAVTRSNMLVSAWVELPDEGQPALVETRFANPSLDNRSVRTSLMTVAARAIEDRKSCVVPMEKVRGGSLVSVPFFVDETTAGAFCAMVHDNRNNCSEAVLICQMITTHYDLWRARDEFTSMAFEVRSTATVLELVGKAQSSDTVRGACFTIANELKELFRCDYVGVGLRRPNKLGLRLMALSSAAEFDNESKTTQLFTSAFDEAVMRESYTVYPARSEGQRSATLSHQKLARHLHCEAAISIPVRDQNEEIIGALTIAGNRQLDRNPSTRNLIHALEHPLGGTVSVVRNAEGGWLKKIRRFISLGDNKMLVRAVVAMSLIALVTMFIPVTNRVPCLCTAEPHVRRVSVAPYDGLLENTFVEPGDLVTSGQLLARMDGREIRFELAEVEANKSQAVKDLDTHSASGRIPEAMMAELEYRQLQERSKLLEHRAGNFSIVSPIDGIVLTGSTDRRENYPVTLGESLFEIAPINPLRVELAVPADQIMHVRTGQQVKFRFEGFGTATVEGTIKRIRPSTTIRGDKNVFIAEAELDNSNGDVRPGMNGNAHIYGTRRLLGWTLFHRPWERIVTAVGF